MREEQMLIYSLGLFVSETAVWSKSAVMSVSSGLRFSTMMAAKNPCPSIVVLAVASLEYQLLAVLAHLVGRFGVNAVDI